MQHNTLKYKLIFLFWGCCTLIKAQAQSKDTVLNMVLSKPYFYNLVQGKEGVIFAGTSEGIFEIDDVNLRQYGSQKGYLTTNPKGEPVIDNTGIRYYKEKKYLYLLPYPELAREEYHAEKGNMLYICSGGRLYIFNIVPYEYSYPEHSIRSISKHFVGTYSGVYLNGKKLGLPGPDFTDGYIREFGDKAFICNYPISILEKDALLTGNLIPGVNYKTYPYDPNKSAFYNDIFYSSLSHAYYIASQNALIRTDEQFGSDSVLYTHTYKDDPITLIPAEVTELYFTAKEELLHINYKIGKIQSILKLDKPILSGLFYDNQLYLLTATALYRYNSGSQLEKLITLEKAHSLVMISGSELVISSDLGLYHFNIPGRTLSPIIMGVEFNRRALYKDVDTIYAGSVNGLYTIRVSDIRLQIDRNKSALKKTGTSNTLLLLAALFTLILFILIVFILRFREKLKVAEETINSLKTPAESVTREKIEAFIQNNLPVASIKTLMDEFKLNAPQLYTILKPDRPGTIIQQIRIATVKKMREAGKSYEEIASATGLSISYLKKLKTS